MVRIRLRRVGLRGQPSYRVIVADKEAQRDGAFLEIVGHYNPRTSPATVVLKEDRIFDWLNKGAQPSESLLKIFKTINFMDRYARFKAGEPVETLLAEASALYASRVTSPKTRHITPTK